MLRRSHGKHASRSRLGAAARAGLLGPLPIFLTACASSPPPPPPLESIAAPAPPPVAAPPDEPTPTFHMAWSTDFPKATLQLAVAPAGDVVSYDLGGRLAVRARDTGKVLEHGRRCETNQFGFVDDSRGVLVCFDRLMEVRFPGLDVKTVVPLGGEAGTSVIGRSLVAVAQRRQVRLFDTSTWKEIDRFAVHARVCSMDLSRDERTLVLGEDTDDDSKSLIELRDIPGQKTRTVFDAGERCITPVAVSPDGSEVFARVSRELASVFSIHDGSVPKVARSYPVSAAVGGARYLTSNLITVAGSEGLSLFFADGSRKRLGFAEPARELAVSADGAVICSLLGSQPQLACYASRQLDPSAYVARASGVKVEVPGTLISRKGDALVLETNYDGNIEDNSPMVGTLYSSIDGSFSVGGGYLSVSGWTGVARVSVTKRTPGKLMLKVIKPLSGTTIDGVTLDDIKTGVDVNLILGD